MKKQTQTQTPKTEENETIILKLKTVDKLLNYLGTRPFQEVAGLINMVQSEAHPQLPK